MIKRIILHTFNIITDRASATTELLLRRSCCCDGAAAATELLLRWSCCCDGAAAATELLLLHSSSSVTFIRRVASLEERRNAENDEITDIHLGLPPFPWYT